MHKTQSVVRHCDKWKDIISQLKDFYFHRVIDFNCGMYHIVENEPYPKLHHENKMAAIVGEF